MEKIKQTGQIKKRWKVFLTAFISVLLLSGYISYVSADSNVKVNLSTRVVTMYQPTSAELLVSSLSGNDDNTSDGKPEINNVEWKSSNESIVKFTTAEGTTETSTYRGQSPVLKAKSAGRATVTATYYTVKYAEDGSVESKQEVSHSDASVIVPLKVDIDDSINGSNANPNTTLYHVGDWINLSPNTTGSNLDVKVENQNVIAIDSSNSSGAVLKVVGGGKTKLTVSTKDADGNNELSKSYDIVVDIKFKPGEQNSAGNHVEIINGEQCMILNKTDFIPFDYEEVPSTIKELPAGATFICDDTSVCSIKKGMIKGESAGVSKFTAGIPISDIDGNTTWRTSDEVKIVVPFKKLGKDVSNMNVGDKIKLQTSETKKKITWTSSNTDVLVVDDDGNVLAKKAGTATITAARDGDDLDAYISGNNNKLTYTINVIDGFGLSTTNTTVNIGETIEISALVTESDIEKNPLKFSVENQQGIDGQTPAKELIKVVQDGIKFKITGVASGTAKITVTQTVNGVEKSASCLVFVATPVGEVTINPSTLTIDRGTAETVQLLFNPEGPSNSNVLWSSSNPDVATVEGDSYTATINGVKGGKATITVITEDGLKVASCEVYVREPVTGLKLNATSVESTMAVGQYQLVATILPEADGVNQKVTWTSSNESVCTVDENGLVKFIQPGYATIICKTEDKSYLATCNFKISIPVESITLDYKDAIMSIGNTLRITAEVLPLEATNRTVAWESSNTNVCIVDSNGLVQAVGTGNATILCKSLDGNCTAMCNIYVKQPVTQVVLNTTDITVRKGQTFWLNATCLPENADNKIITWESKDENVCTVESDGKVTATGPGVTSVIATNPDSGLTGYCVVTVTQPVTGITLNSDYQQMWVGAKYAIIPNIEPIDAENKNVTYLSSDPEVATVDENGVVTAVKGGSCVIEVTTEECKLTAACTIDVKEYVSSITLNETDKYMNIGASGTLKATVGSATATNKGISWSSSNNGICSVDANGNIHANSPGTAVITATAVDGSGVSASCIIHSVNPVTSISIEPDTVRMLVGDSKIVQAVVSPENATIKDVVWTSSNESVATVDEAGEIFGVGTGKCKITATSKDGNAIKGVCWVYVTPVVNISSLKINSSEIYMLTGRTRHLSVRVRPSYNTDSYEWYSTDTGIVTVSGNGTITTVGPGTADVVVESENAGVTSTCTVHSLAISKSSIVLEQYDKFWLDVIGTTDTVRWRSSNPRVCTVSSSGEVVARKAGTTTVTATVNNKTLTCTVKVVNFR